MLIAAQGSHVFIAAQVSPMVIAALRLPVLIADLGHLCFLLLRGLLC